jgi:hypothetical protein
MAEARAGDFTRRLHLEQRQPTPRGFRDDVDFAPALIAPVVGVPSPNPGNFGDLLFSAV